MPERDELLDALAYAKARENIEVIADELDLECRRTVSRLELRHLARDNGPDLRKEQIRDFAYETIIAEAVDAKGNTTYLAVAASYTGDLEDAGRARSHAALMQRLTKQGAQPGLTSTATRRRRTRSPARYCRSVPRSRVAAPSRPGPVRRAGWNRGRWGENLAGSEGEQEPDTLASQGSSTRSISQRSTLCRPGRSGHRDELHAPGARRQHAVHAVDSERTGATARPARRSCAIARARTRVAYHLPRAIGRQPHQPARLAHVSLAIPRRALPVEPPQVSVLAARARDHELLLRHQSCRRVSSPLRQPASQDRLDRAVIDSGNLRAVDPPPAAAHARRIAARHANRQSQRRAHRPDPLPRAGPPPATRPHTARPSPPPSPDAVNRHRRRPRDPPARRTAPGTPPHRTAPTPAAPRPPRRSSPRGTRRRRPP